MWNSDNHWTENRLCLKSLEKQRCISMSMTPNSWWAMLEQLLYDSKLQERLRTRGFERVKQFTWERAARETLEVYQEFH